MQRSKLNTRDESHTLKQQMLKYVCLSMVVTQ